VVKEFVGGYSDWKRTAIAGVEASSSANRRGPNSSGRSGSKSPGISEAPDQPKKLGWKEKREWEELPVRIEVMEAELRELHERMADPAFFEGGQKDIRPIIERSQAVSQEIDEALTLWVELDERS
jgi:ATP-binding cassette subfamily F protein uup